jgi:hypothetical protein
MVLFDLAALVVYVQRWDNSFRKDPSAKTTRRVLFHDALKDQLYLVGSAQV